VSRLLYLLTIALAGLCAAVLALVLVWTSSPSGTGSGGAQGFAAVAFVALVYGLGVLPYGLVALFAHMNRGSGLALGAALATLVVIGLFGFRELRNAFVANPDAQSALVLLFLPINQLGLLLPLVAGLMLARFLRRGR
jgi:hypothetical protein